MTRQELQKLQKIVDSFADQIGEHFEAVQILATTSDGDESVMIRSGNGNWYARRGMVQKFIELDNVDELASAIVINGDEDDDWKDA